MMIFFECSKSSYSLPSGKKLWDTAGLKLTQETGTWVVAVIGPTGCGKTTLIRVLAGLDSGGGLQFSRNTGLRLGYLPQRPVVFPGISPEENARFMERIGSQREAAIEAEGVYERFKTSLRLEFSQLSTKWEDWSGGEIQRLCLLRTMSTDPEIVLLDEPCTGIDSALRLNIIRELRSWAKERGRLVVYVTHHSEEVLQVADCILAFDGLGPPYSVSLRRLDLQSEVNVKRESLARCRPDIVVLGVKYRGGVSAHPMIEIERRWVVECSGLTGKLEDHNWAQAWIAIEPSSFCHGGMGVQTRVNQVLEWLPGLALVEMEDGLRLLVPSILARQIDGISASISIEGKAWLFFGDNGHLVKLHGTDRRTV